MPNYNSCFFIGHLTRDPEMRATQSGMSICKGGIAVTEKRKDKESTLFLDFTAFDKAAELISQYLKKGSAVGLQGRLEYQTWEDKESGGKRSKHALVVDKLVFLGGGKAAAGKPAQDEMSFDEPAPF